ncbi:D-glycero-beta-D-manno-heptose-7-phosphate kinase, partial [Acidobacteria bacterium AH-259-A15]|nr:D-glycero-beta-D-manno-heptose-7-phosphate kinase [Acidobacteria bacterium AH-259-A15]
MKDSLSQLVDKFSDLKILVLGDFLLDQFVFGEISRVSREAPVLILKYQNTHSVPGGGANTVANVESLGAKAIPL